MLNSNDKFSLFLNVRLELQNRFSKTNRLIISRTQRVSENFEVYNYEPLILVNQKGCMFSKIKDSTQLKESDEKRLFVALRIYVQKDYCKTVCFNFNMSLYVVIE